MDNNLKVTYLPIEDLIPSARNARTHTDAQIAQIAASIREFGWTNPALVDERKGLIAGHGRILAARVLNMDMIPTIELAGLSEAQKRAYMIADNRLAELAGWNDELLAIELQDLLVHEQFDINLIGYSEEDLATLLQGIESGAANEDDVPPLEEVVVTEPGDLWVMGNHRLLCGDATNADDTFRLMDNVQPMLMVTDPPYSVEYDPNWRNPKAAKRKGVTNDDRVDWGDAWALFPGDVAYVWHSSLLVDTVMESLERHGLQRRAMIIWVKQKVFIGRGHYNWQHESLLYCVRKGGKGHWSGGHKQTTIWQIANKALVGQENDDGQTTHVTQKPVECMRRPIENNSAPGQPVYDPFLGSGTTLIAAETTKRACLGLELQPQFCDVIVRRWERFTGQEAKLESGETFAALAESRGT